MSKGQGTTIQSVFWIFIVVLFSIMMIALWLNVGHETVRIELEKTEILRTKNIFLFTNRSLGMTWQISTVQTVFGAGDTSLNAGDKYWYNYNPNSAKSVALPTSVICNAPLSNPRICLPQDTHISDYLRFLFVVGGFTDIKKEFKADGVRVKIDDISINSPNNFWPAYDVITGKVTQHITAELEQTKTEADTENNVLIFTKFDKMVFAGWRLVDLALFLNNALPYFKYPSSDTVSSDYNHATYQTAFDRYIADKINDIESWTEPEINIQRSLSSSLQVPTVETDGQIPTQSGLLYEYKIDATFIESSSGLSPGINPGITTRECKPAQPEYEQFIRNAVSSKRWSFNSIDFTNEEIVAIVKGIINQESGWNQNLCSDIEFGCGLMQLAGDTARGCPGGVDAIRDNPSANIDCGVGILHAKFDAMKSENDYDKLNLVKLTLAAYNGGQGTINKAIDIAGDSKWESINNMDAMGQATANVGYGSYSEEKAQIIIIYVPLVLGCYSYYSQNVQPIFGPYQYSWPLSNNQRTVTLCWNAVDANVGYSPSYPHKGLDVGVPTGTDVRAITDGRVVYAGAAGTLGNMIQIKHDGDDRYSLYAHLQDNGILVSVGDSVRRGQIIGKSDSTGFVKGAHLHLEIKNNASLSIDRSTLNPCNYLDCGGQCDATPGQIDFGQVPVEYYYYHDTENNKFFKRPFELPVSVVDYLPILDCRENNNKRYNWEAQNDMLCSYDDIWSCQQDILGLDSNHKLDDHEFAGTNLPADQRIWQCVSSAQITPRFCLKGFDTNTDEECCKLWLPSENGVLCRNEGFCTGDDVQSGSITVVNNPPQLQFNGEGCMSEDFNKDLTPDQYCNNALTINELTPSVSNCCSWACQNDDWVCTDTNNAVCQSSGVCSTNSACQWQCGNGVQPTGTCGTPPPTPPCAFPNECNLNCPLDRLANGICQGGLLCCVPFI